MRSSLLLAAVLAAVTATVARAQQARFDSLAGASLAQLDGRAVAPGLRQNVDVIRDRWGVPHIYARNLDDLFFAQGYVQASDRLWQMDMYRRQYEGRLAEIMGPSMVAHDRLVRLLNYRGPMDDREWTQYHPAGKRVFQAFADGVNAYIASHRARLPVEYALTGLVPIAWTPEVALLRTQTAMPVSDALLELRLARNVARLGVDSANRAARPSPFRALVPANGVDLDIISQAPIDALGALFSGTVRPPLLPEYQRVGLALPSENRGVQEHSPGSNNWVVSGRLTASGNVIVANDPHRTVANPSIRYIVHLDAPGYRAIGATEPALPGVLIGRTERLAWGLTIVGTDQADVYVERLDSTLARASYRGRWEPFRIVRDTIRVLGAAPVIVAHQFTRHGPVFYTDSVNRVAYAMRATSALPGTAGYLSALRYPALADCRAFLDVQRYWLAPTENMICGDTRGNIAWQASAASPDRPNWHGRLPVPGTGEYEWRGLLQKLPRELNPARGWIATANNDIHPEGWNPPLFFKNTAQSARRDRVAAELGAPGKRFTMLDMQALQHDAFNAAGAGDAALFAGWTSPDAAVERDRALLAAWDGQHGRDSRAAALYRFASRLVTPAIRTERDAAVRGVSLERAVVAARDSLRRVIGPDEGAWTWGRFNRSELPHALSRAYDIPAVERTGGAGFVAAVGATFRELFDMGSLDSGLATNAPGQSGQPRSPFYANLVEGFGRAEYFPLAFTREAVEKVAAHRLMLVPR